MAEKESNGRLEWLRDELQSMEHRITKRIDQLEAATMERLNDHSKRLSQLEKVQLREDGAQMYKRWLIATSFGLIGAIGALVGIVATVLGGNGP